MPHNTLAIASALGCAQAKALGVVPAVLSEHYRTRMEQVASVLSERQCLLFGAACGTRAVAVWKAMFPDDTRPDAAIVAVQHWLQDDAYRADFSALANAAEHSHIDADYPELTEDVDPQRCAAMEAASACSHAALLVQAVQNRDEHQEICELVGWIARFAVKSASDQQREINWQTKCLIDLLAEIGNERSE